jgi:hypothetical protein
MGLCTNVTFVANSVNKFTFTYVFNVLITWRRLCNGELKMKFKPLKITKKSGGKRLISKRHPASQKVGSSRNRKVNAPPEKSSTAEGRQ